MKIRRQDTRIIGFWDAAAEYVDVVAGRRRQWGAPLQANLPTEGLKGVEARTTGKGEQYLDHNPNIDEEKVCWYWKRNRGSPPSVQSQVNLCTIRNSK